MPIIIWGSRGLRKHLNNGLFYCPNCDSQQHYDLKQVREFFTLYFIPLFPVGGAHRYVECHGCSGTFKEGVLEMEPPGETDRALRRFYNDLQTGSSMEDVERRLVELGMEAPQAHELVGQMVAEDVWTCETCGDHYVKAVRRCTRCKA